MTVPVDLDSIARRRRRLSIDYQDLSNTWLDKHNENASGLQRFVFQCFMAVRRQFLVHYFVSPPRWRVWVRQLTKQRAMPDFCIVGPPKSGTSDLALTIMSHPHVLGPMVKEFTSTDPNDWRPFYPTLSELERYRNRRGVGLCPLVAPCLHCIDIPISLSSLRPNTKIVINLRNPVDLVFSEWKWTVLHTKKHLVAELPFLETFAAYVEMALEHFPEAPSPLFTALHCGIYANSVAHWLRAFGERNVRIFDVAEYFKDRDSYLLRLEQFLGLPYVPLPPLLPVANRNPLQALTRCPDASAKLSNFFEPYNRRLWDVIGTVYPW